MKAPEAEELRIPWVRMAPAEAVADWISSHQGEDPDSLVGLFPEGVTSAAIERGDPLIDFAVALYAEDTDDLAVLSLRAL